MKNLYLSGLAVTTLLLFGSSAARGQAPLRIDDSGKVVTNDQHKHAKVGNKITWTRESGAKKPWFVKFAADSPCDGGGTEFGSAGVKTCRIKVACKKVGDPGCKAYKYSSATGPKDPLNDPDIIVDP